MSLWCPRWCRHPTAAAWRSVLMDSLWTWTRPSTNTTTSAHTPALCWTLSSDQHISLPKLIHKQFIQAMGMISNIFMKSFDQWRDILDWNVKKQQQQKKTGPGVVVQLEP